MAAKKLARLHNCFVRSLWPLKIKFTKQSVDEAFQLSFKIQLVIIIPVRLSLLSFSILSYSSTTLSSGLKAQLLLKPILLFPASKAVTFQRLATLETQLRTIILARADLRESLKMALKNKPRKSGVDGIIQKFINDVHGDQ